MTSTPPTPMSGARKAAILLILLGDEAASGICKHLSEDELRKLAREITELDYIPPDVATAVLQDYLSSTTGAKGHVAQGGPEFATKLLVKMLGDEGARPLVDQVVRSQTNSAQSLEALQKADPEQLAKLLQDEHPQTIALVLAHLNENKIGPVLSILPEAVRAQAIKRLAQLQNFSPDMVARISGVLQRKLEALGGGQGQERQSYGGVKAVAALLNSVNSKMSANILEGIEQDSSELAESIRNQMFTFEDFIKVPDAGLRELLTQIDKKALATALKSASEDLKGVFYKCMSSRAVEMLKEDTEALGKLRAKDIQQAQMEIITVARKLEADGKLVLRPEPEDVNV